MPAKCSVPACRGNYDAENKVSVFKFPEDESLRNIWMQRISREGFKPTSNSRVCCRHFAESCIETHTEAFDEKLGKIISAPLERPRLKKGAIPTIFLGYPSYMTETGGENSRENPEQKRLKQEERNVQAAIKCSLQSKANYDTERTFTSIQQLGECLTKFKPTSFWDVIIHIEEILFLNLQCDSDGKVSLNYAVHVDKMQQLTVSYRGESLTTFKPHIFPTKVSNINDIFTILEAIEKNNNSHLKLQSVEDIIMSLLSNLADVLEDKKKKVEFLKEQISLILTKPEKYRYSPETLIFASMLYLISPTAYKFIRLSGELILPHPSTIKKISGKFNINPLDETKDSNFLSYAKQRVKSLEKHELYVSLMLDEIHLKECFDYKGGNIVGFANGSQESATSAHVFMLQSLFSKFKEVVYILPVKKMTADTLFTILNKIIVNLEHFGFKVIVVVTDNNSINRKCMKNFNNPTVEYVYPHPCNPERPLFYCVDPVHIIKSVRNNWVNQKNGDQAMYFPNFDLASNDIHTASLLSVKKLYEIESGSLLKYGYTLSQKALWPSSLEKQSVTLALQLFDPSVSKSLSNLGEGHNILNYSETANYIEIFYLWFSIMNVKSPNKGLCKRDTFSSPLTFNENDEKLIFFHKFLSWIEKWEKVNSDTGKLTRETFSALKISTNCMIDLVSYCTSELGMSYLLPGKIQTDELEYRFSLYRQMAGTHYHISIRQIFEVEKKLRTCNVLKLAMNSKSKKTVIVNEFINDINDDVNEETLLNDNFASVSVTDDDVSKIQSELPVLTFLAGYCTHSVIYTKLKCDACKNNLTIDKQLAVEENFKVISDFDRGGLKYPTVDVLDIIIHNYIVVKKLIIDLEDIFFNESNQRQIVLQITLNILSIKDIVVASCNNHSSEKILPLIIRASTNTLLKNYCKTRNDTLSKKQNKRKLATLSN